MGEDDYKILDSESVWAIRDSMGKSVDVKMGEMTYNISLDDAKRLSKMLARVTTEIGG